MKFKYVMIDETTPIIFDQTINHRTFKHLLGEITSGGTIDFEIINNKIQVNISDSELITKEVDSFIIENIINNKN